MLYGKLSNFNTQINKLKQINTIFPLLNWQRLKISIIYIQSWQECGGSTPHALLVGASTGPSFLDGSLATHIKSLKKNKIFARAIPNIGTYP